ncbi:copper chaperone PCu(A)C [Gammaproteobacteria bacterium LSUCC0057]|uniref:Copper chaperone PCu(A)C n=1 Tax=Gammaproteobacteria bacterium LSUCC0057 TaxID=2559237 RepID=A0A4Y8UIR5_9GAMM|nr:copper chaperone PCu(A)C [Gammaproteobacteria bacterium LSUCC0057]
MQAVSRWVRHCGAALCLALVAAAHGQVQALSVEQGWVRALPPGKTVTAGFAEIVNRSTQACSIEALASPQAERVELHSTAMEGGVMRMRPAPLPTLAANSALSLAPGGLHWMFIGVDRHAAHAGALTVTITSSCGELSAALPLLRMAPDSDHSHH